MIELILASTSPFRAELLARLGLPFQALPPTFDEEEITIADPPRRALARAIAKARSLTIDHPDRFIIGSDQVAELDGAPLGKPGTHAEAAAQLARMSGRTVIFHTGLALIRHGEEVASGVDHFSVRLRELSAAEIDAYLEKDEPYGCAGSFRIEALGVALMEEMEGPDYTSLIGLPLIRLCRYLREAGVEVLFA